MRRPSRKTLTGVATAALLIACFIGVHQLLDRDDNFVSVLGSAILGGALLGALLSVFIRRGSRARELAGHAQLTPRERRRAARAVTRGPAPAEPPVRDAALVAARRRYRRVAGYNWVDRLFGAGMVALALAFAFYDSPIFWVAVLVSTAALAYAEWERRILPGRIAGLEA